MQEKIVKQTSTTAQTIPVKTADHASTWSTATNAFAESHLLEEIVIPKWIHALRIVAAMELDAHQVQTIKTFIVPVPSAMLVDCAMKTLTNVNFRHRHAEMVPRAKTLMAPINAYVPKDTKEKTVP